MAEANKISTDADLMTEIGSLAAGQQAGVPQVDVVRPTVQTGEIQTTTGAQLSGQVVAPTGIAPTTGIEVTAPATPADLGQVGAIQQIAPQVEAMDAAQIEAAPQIDMTQIQGTLSPGAMATAATQELDKRATVQYQLGELLGSIEEGKPMPAWACPLRYFREAPRAVSYTHLRAHET